MSISLAHPLKSLQDWLGKQENFLPGHRPPAILPSREQLIVHAPRDTAQQQTPRGAVPAQGVTLDLMTYNVWGLPGFLGQQQKERMPLIGEGVRGHGIVALQETFTRQASAIGQMAQYPYELRGSDGGPLRIKSGVTMLSSYAVLAHDFVPFQQAADSDRLSQKGVLFMRVQVPGVGPVDVYTTHFQANEHDDIRQHDVDTMVDLVHRHDQGNPTFILGDFNFDSTEPAYQELVRRLGLRDAQVERHPGELGGTITGENSHQSPTRSPRRIDYIFVMPNERFDIAIDSVERGMTERVNGQNLSDHFGVIGQFRITPRPTPPNPN